MLAKDIVMLVGGEEYLGATGILRILMISFILTFWREFFGECDTDSNETRKVLYDCMYNYRSIEYNC